MQALKPLQRFTSPILDVPSNIARQAYWVEAELVGDVEYRQFGGALRHPAWKGLRVDVEYQYVRLPS